MRLLDLDFARLILHIGPAYRVVYVLGWNASKGRNALFQWTYDIPNIIEARVCTWLPLFRIAASSFLMSRDNSATIPRGRSFSSSQCVLEFGKIDDARTALRMPDGRAGPDSETFSVGLSRLPAVAVDI